MHLGAACGTRTVALFGPTIEANWHPWQAPYRIVTARTWAPDSSDFVGTGARNGRRTDAIDADDVIAACDSLIAESGSSLLTG
jgi:ADP-heptose:LPS heptosyltransferase